MSDEPVLADLLGPEWEARAFQQSVEHLERAVATELHGGAKILRWHITFLRAEVARIPVDYPTVFPEHPEIGPLLDAAEQRARDLEALLLTQPTK
jgi:hypothetical protein